MRNHFFISYSGNKRKEVETIYENIKLEGVKTIIEPFCGSSSFSYYISLKHPQKFKYILNDNDTKLIELYKLCKNEKKMTEFINKVNEIILDKDFGKNEYLEVIKRDDIIGYYIKNKIFTLRPGLFPLSYKPKKLSLSCPILDFIKTENIKFTNLNGNDVIKKYQHKPEYLIYLDPPYLLTCNAQYEDSDDVKDIFSYLYKLRDHKAKIYLSIESNCLIDIIFEQFEKVKYEKKYNGFRKRVAKILLVTI